MGLAWTSTICCSLILNLKMNTKLKIGSIPITAKLLLYTLLTISVISSVLVNTLHWVTLSESFLEIFIMGLVSLLAGIGFIAIILAIILEVVERWHRIGGVIFLGIAIYMLWGILYSYNQELSPFYNHPYLLVPLLMVALSWVIYGVIIIIHGKSFLTAKGS